MILGSCETLYIGYLVFDADRHHCEAGNLK